MIKTLSGNSIKKVLLLFTGILLVFGCTGNKNNDLAESVGLVGSPQGEVWIKKQDGTYDTIAAPATADGVFESAELSPNKEFVLLTAPIGDGGEAWVYHLKDGKLHDIEGGFGLGEMGWLEDNRIILHQGCIMAAYCLKLESINNTTPWDMEVTEDLGKGD